ncbi:MAG: GNAT family N-acetyltransferase [Actinomycetes bacterium]
MTQKGLGPDSGISAESTGKSFETAHAQLSVRCALSSDEEELIRLRELARLHLCEQRGGELEVLSQDVAGESSQDLLAESTQQDRLVLIALIGEVSVGYSFAQSLRLSEQYSLCLIKELFVESGAREIGVGELLMQAVTAWAQERGCSGIDAVAMPGDRDTKNFFETFGLVARSITVHQDLRGK